MGPITYVRQGDEQVDKVFVEKLEEVAKHIYKKFKSFVPMIFDKVAEELHNSQSECYACGEKFSSEKQGLRKVRDHCHNTEKYRGALHSKYNLRLRRSRTIPVYFFTTLRATTVTYSSKDRPTRRAT